MRKFFSVLGIAVGLGLAAPVSAHWLGKDIDPPGIPWAACSARYGCAHPVYTRRLVPLYAPHRIVHRRVTVRYHVAHPVHRRARRVAHRRWRPRRVYSAYAVRAAFQYINDPQLAAAVAWADVVNAEASWR